ncbi:carboxymuconolactone decarboxylase family protein [Halomonas cupida]|uniref:carboxymuconolactone decarboxylase family protein n=1 Tax=Halomonas cupida TaxID=44933 RepID=UPI00135650C4|nr:carboxymuconolactone decarboxylase family protein [Halomonas cupida]
MARHINLALDSGLSQAEVSELPAQITLYTGWPSIFAALPIAQDVLESLTE